MTQLGNVLREEFIQRAQAEAERSFREENIEVQKLFEKQRKELAARDAQERAQRKRFDDQIRTQVAAATYTIELLIEGAEIRASY